MPFTTAIRIASRPVVRWLLIAVLAASAAGWYFYDDESNYRTCEETLELMEEFESGTRIMTLITDRANRWLEAHPDRACPRIEEITKPSELIEAEFKTVELLCGDRQYMGRRVVAITVTPLVNWPSLQVLQSME